MVKVRIVVVMALMCSLFLAGCYHFHHTAGSAQRSVAMTDAGAGRAFEVSKPWVSMWLWGLVGADINVDELIANEVGRNHDVSNIKIDTKMSFLNGLVNCLTMGIYSPQSLTIKGEYK